MAPLALDQDLVSQGLQSPPLAPASPTTTAAAHQAPPGDSGLQSAFRPRGCNLNRSDSAACPRGLGAATGPSCPGCLRAPHLPQGPTTLQSGVSTGGEARLLIVPAPGHILSNSNLRSRVAQGSPGPREEGDPQVFIRAAGGRLTRRSSSHLAPQTRSPQP